IKVFPPLSEPVIVAARFPPRPMTTSRFPAVWFAAVAAIVVVFAPLSSKPLAVLTSVIAALAGSAVPKPIRRKVKKKIVPGTIFLAAGGSHGRMEELDAGLERNIDQA